MYLLLAQLRTLSVAGHLTLANALSSYMTLWVTCLAGVKFEKNHKFRSKFEFTNHLGSHVLSMIKITSELNIFRKLDPPCRWQNHRVRLESRFTLQTQVLIASTSNLPDYSLITLQPKLNLEVKPVIHVSSSSNSQTQLNFKKKTEKMPQECNELRFSRLAMQNLLTNWMWPWVAIRSIIYSEISCTFTDAVITGNN